MWLSDHQDSCDSAKRASIEAGFNSMAKHSACCFACIARILLQPRQQELQTGKAIQPGLSLIMKVFCNSDFERSGG